MERIWPIEYEHILPGDKNEPTKSPGLLLEQVHCPCPNSGREGERGETPDRLKEDALRGFQWGSERAIRF